MKDTDKGELYLMVLWEKARFKEAQILASLRKELEVIGTYDIRWTPDCVTDNFARLFGISHADAQKKQQECGGGNFLVITLRDAHPRYEVRETDRGHESVNSRIADLLSEYRAWTESNSRIDTTYTRKESDFFMTLLLGVNLLDYADSTHPVRQAPHKAREQDLPGANGWQSPQELFDVLNHTVDYVVLQEGDTPACNTEKAPCKVELLTRDLRKTLSLLNAKPEKNAASRAQYAVSIGGKQVSWTIRTTGDNYYCEAWAEDMLTRRQLSAQSVYKLSDADYFYAQIYHAVVHQACLSSGIKQQLSELYSRLVTNPPTSIDSYPSPLDEYNALMEQFMKGKGYEVVRPADTSVQFNQMITRGRKMRKITSRNPLISNIRQIRLNMGKAHKPVFFRADFNGRDVFIKWMTDAETCVNEYRYGRDIYDACPKHVVEPIAYWNTNDCLFVATEYENSPTLEEVLKEQALSSEVKRSFVSQLADIARVLLRKKIVHRDIRPANLLVTADNTLKLIDFEFAVSAKCYKESAIVRKRASLIVELGAEYAPQKYVWDDMYSIAKIMSELGAAPEQNEDMMFVSSHIGKMRIVHEHRLSILARRKFLRIISKLVPVARWRRAIRKQY